jgi:hypothetical protein
MVDPGYDYSQELEIVWVRDPLQYHYLRESVQKMNFRAKPPSAANPLVRDPNILVGYVNLRSTARSDSPGRFVRRYWWLMDRDVADEHGWKAEAVDPRSIKAGQVSSTVPLD